MHLHEARQLTFIYSVRLLVRKRALTRSVRLYGVHLRGIYCINQFLEYQKVGDFHVVKVSLLICKILYENLTFTAPFCCKESLQARF